MNLNQFCIAGSYTHENFSIFILTGVDALCGNRIFPLDEAPELYRNLVAQ